jgi:hypothetical protein
MTEMTVSPFRDEIDPSVLAAKFAVGHHIEPDVLLQGYGSWVAVI